MLVLTRQPQQCLVIDKSIEITVLGVRGKQVKIGIKAPKNIEVHRREVFEKINGTVE
ncbi:MAG: carbon storage regulator [Gammaproteobacteria bacterium RIFCSPHIGHO2_12_FULL_41_15]|nr:MAG: carbon storage regulator [Gammaproteobacteria bacterium RIFCSPHIGHO2_12_FULL_41_15]